jgi:uncharacterized protein
MARRAFGFTAALMMVALTVMTGLQAGAAQAPIPPAGHRVVDQSHLLKPSEVRELADSLQALQDKSGAQVAILIAPTAGDEGIAPFANRVFVAWGLGKKGVDNGVLIVLVANDRKVRIEVGRGLEGDIPDAVAKDITADVMAPEFKAGRYFEGMKKGLDALAKRLGVAADDKADAASGNTPAELNAAPPPIPDNIGVSSASLFNPFCGTSECSDDLLKLLAVSGFLLFLVVVIVYQWRHTSTRRSGSGGSSDSRSDSSSSSSSTNDSSGGGGDSAGGGSDSSY